MQGTVLRARRRAVPLVGAMVAALAGLGLVVPMTASATTGCEAEYQAENDGTRSGAPGESRLDGLACAGADEAPAPPEGDASATEIVDAMQPGFNLGNNLDAVGPDETAWGYPRVTPEFLQSVRDDGFNSVRIPVTWDYHQEDTGDYAVDEAWLDRVEEVVQYALDEDLYVLLNVHHDSWIWMADMQSDREEVLARYEALWTAIAERFRDHPDTVLFESVNEPQFNDVDDETAYGLLDELNRSFHRIVRGSGGANAERVLVLPTLYTNDEQARLDALNATFDALDDPNVAATIHYYGLWPFSVNIAGYTTFDDEVRQHIVDAYDRTHDAFVARGIPVVIGEWSLLGYQPDGKVQQGETLKFLEYAYWYAEERDLTVMLWDIAPHFERETLEWRDQELWAMFQASWTGRSGTASSDQVFVERAGAVTDATLTLNPNGLDFEGLREGDAPLVEGEDYTVSGDRLTIEAAALERIVGTDGYGAQTDLYADFSQGVPWRISVIAYDEPSAADAAGTTDAFAIPTQFNGDQLATMESVYDDGTAAGPTDWTAFQEFGSAFQPDYEGGVITMPPAFFDAVDDDRPVTLTFHFWSGATVAYQVAVSGDTVTGTAG